MPDEVQSSSQIGMQPAAPALIAELGRFVPLNEEERKALLHLSRNGRRLLRGTDLISKGDKPESVFLLLEGWAYRYKSMVSGGR